MASAQIDGLSGGHPLPTTLVERHLGLLSRLLSPFSTLTNHDLGNENLQWPSIKLNPTIEGKYINHHNRQKILAIFSFHLDFSILTSLLS